MQINRYNYEEYFLLYTDNELNTQERAAVEAFTAANPDLQEELNRLQHYKLVPEKLVFPGKENLLKQAPHQFINTNNYEEYFLLYADNELSERERSGVEQFVHAHPALLEEFTLINQAVLTPGDAIRFPAKERLYRYENDKVVPLAWWKVAAAAAVVLIAGVLWLNKQHTEMPQQLARQDTSAGKKPAADGLTSSALNSKSVSSDIHRTPAVQIDSLATTIRQPEIASTVRIEKRVTKKIEKSLPRSSSPAENDIEQVHTNSIAINSINPSALKVREPIIDKPAVFGNQGVVEALDDAGTNAAKLASNNDTEEVYISNVQIDKKIALRGFFRKASRIINKATGLNTGEKGILIGNVEIALK